jgi:hypothetical protein
VTPIASEAVATAASVVRNRDAAGGGNKERRDDAGAQWRAAIKHNSADRNRVPSWTAL